VKSKFNQLDARRYITSLAASGRYSFTSAQAQEAMGGTAAATKLALNRLAKQGMIASPARGFYVIVPPEYQSLGCLPADQFIPDLMSRQGHYYYVGLLSAAQYHGAGHHRPQMFQVMLAKNRRPIACGAVRVSFMARSSIAEVPTVQINTLRGTIKVSTPEATVLDLVGYPEHAGGLDQIATILSELAEQIDAQKLVQAAQSAPITWAQRLGYLLDFVDACDKTKPLAAYVKDHAREATRLLPAASIIDASRDKVWKIFENATVEPDA
jgi:predicted transcriptional regulator of viral defense system